MKRPTDHGIGRSTRRHPAGLRLLALANAVCFLLMLSVDLLGVEAAAANGQSITAPRETLSRFIASNRTLDQDGPVETSACKGAAVRPREARVAMRARRDPRGDDFESPAPRPIAHRKRLPRRYGSRSLDEAH